MILPKKKRSNGLPSSRRDQSPRQRGRRRLLLEQLESRQLLAAVAQGGEGEGTNVRLAEMLYLPPQRSQVIKVPGFLSTPAAGDALTVAQNYLKANGSSLGLTAADVNNSVVTSRHTDSRTGITHIYLQQTYNGLPVLDATANISLMPDGRVITASANYVAGLTYPTTFTSLTPAVGSTSALQSFASYARLPVPSSVSVVQSPSGRSQKTVLSSTQVATGTIPAELVYVPNASGGVELAWRVQFKTPDYAHSFDAAVAATGSKAGQVIRAVDLVQNLASYNVFPQSPVAVQDPLFGNRALVIDPHNTVASPFGWHDTNFVPGSESLTTSGNNAVVIPDPALGVPPPNGGPNLVFNFPFNPAGMPPANIDAAVTNAFYWVNLVHDVSYNHGFDEAAGNFQLVNRTGAGLAGDPLQVIAQFGSPNAINNAFLAPAPDGQSPFVLLGLFNSTTPFRDFSFDAFTIVHEVMHGISTRLTGGAANVNSLNALQSDAMGEGWSDWLALVMTMRPTDTPATPRTLLNWILNQPVNGPGARRFPYSFDMTVNPLTANNYNGDIFPGQNNSESHNAGEIWASALWDLTWLLINKYGFSTDLNGTTGGQNKALDLVLTALKLQPTNPSFQQARDALIAADFALNAGNNWELIWQAFARRGFGNSFISPNANSLAVFAGFDQPLPAARVQGTVFSDPNANGVWDTGESVLAGITVYNDGNNNGQLDAGETQTVTDSNGFYSLAFSTQQTVNIRQSLPANLIQTFPKDGAGHTLLVSPNQTYTGRNFGNKAAPGLISGTKFNDLNADGIRQLGVPGVADEPGVQGIYIYVDLNNDGRLSLLEPAAVTDYFGNYTIKNVPAGNNYIVRELAQPGMGTQTMPGIGAPVPYAHVVTVVSGQTTSGINFGNTLAIDFGDAPDSYGTTLARNGARHGILPGFHLGATVDAEPDGIPHPAALGDDLSPLPPVPPPVPPPPPAVDDEDGVVLVGPGISPGTQAQVQVTIQTGGMSAGRLHAWVDFNRNGAFEASEKVFSNLLLGTGVHLLAFAVPQNASIGQTFARFRYGYETDLPPVGPSIAGEVEDYLFNILPTVPVANPDQFVVPVNPNPIQFPNGFPLDVLANDIPTVLGNLRVVAGDFPILLANGSIRIVYDAAANVLRYQRVAGTPNPAPGTELTFTYRATDGVNTSNPATVTLVIDIRAVDDTYNVNPLTDVVRQIPNDPNSPVISIVRSVSPLVNDAFVANTNARITNVTQETNTQASATVNVVNPTQLDFSAPPNFRGTAIFTYTLDDDDPNTTPSLARATFQVMEPAATEQQLRDAGYLAELDVQILNPTTGLPISVVNQGEQFLLRVTGKDLRDSSGGQGTTANRGITSAYLDLLLNPYLRSIHMAPVADPNNPLGFAVTFDPYYNEQRSGAVVTLPPVTRYLDEVGAFHFLNTAGDIIREPGNPNNVQFVGKGPGDQHIFTIIMQATAPTPVGQPVQIVPDPADDPALAVEIMPPNPPGFVPSDQLITQTVVLDDNQTFLGFSGPLTILPAGGGEFVNRSNPLDVNLDNAISPSDALTVINTINTLGVQSVLSPVLSQSLAYKVDANMDSALSAADALVVINYLNALIRTYASSANGEGEAGPAASGDTAGSLFEVELALLASLEASTAHNTSTSAAPQPVLWIDPATAAGEGEPAAGGASASGSGPDGETARFDPDAADELFALLSGDEGNSRLSDVEW